MRQLAKKSHLLVSKLEESYKFIFKVTGTHFYLIAGWVVPATYTLILI